MTISMVVPCIAHLYKACKNFSGDKLSSVAASLRDALIRRFEGRLDFTGRREVFCVSALSV